jgi:hypothetical protein
VRADLQGFRAAIQENVIVVADNTARVDLHLEIGALEEGIIVKGESPLLDTTSATKQTVLTREVLDSLPNRVDVWAAARVIPSVILSKVDVGGSESFLQSSATVHGSTNENAFLIDGMDVSNLDGNGSAAIMYLDPYAFEETNYQTGSAGTAVNSKGGLLFNMVTRTGTNKFRGARCSTARITRWALPTTHPNSAISCWRRCRPSRWRRIPTSCLVPTS